MGREGMPEKPEGTEGTPEKPEGTEGMPENAVIVPVAAKTAGRLVPLGPPTIVLGKAPPEAGIADVDGIPVVDGIPGAGD